MLASEHNWSRDQKRTQDLFKNSTELTPTTFIWTEAGQRTDTLRTDLSTDQPTNKWAECWKKCIKYKMCHRTEFSNRSDGIIENFFGRMPWLFSVGWKIGPTGICKWKYRILNSNESNRTLRRTCNYEFKLEPGYSPRQHFCCGQCAACACMPYIGRMNIWININRWLWQG